MRDFVRRRPRRALLATALGISGLAFAQHYLGFRPTGDWLLSFWGLWWGVCGALLGIGWLAAMVGAYRLLEGPALVTAWLEGERRHGLSAGFVPALFTGVLLVTLEEVLLRDVLLSLTGPFAVVAAAGLWRLQGGRRSTLWGTAHALLLTGVALISGNLVASWLAHVLTEWVWLGYLALAPWRQVVVRPEGTGAL